MSLIMVHCYNYIIPASDCLREYAVRRCRFFLRNIDSFCHCLIYCRLDFLNFLCSKQSVFSAVWVKTCHTNLWILNTYRLAGIICNSYNFKDSVLLYLVTCLPERNMRRYVYNPQILVRKHHCVLVCMGVLCINLCMSRIMMSCHIYCLFI